MNLTDPKTIKRTLEQNGFRFSKARGQNFLVDASVPERIASLVDDSMGVLEIGPGFGALTQALCRHAGKVVAVEVDKRLIPILAKNLSSCENLTLLEGDALKLDLDAISDMHFKGFCPAVAANLPYSITSDLLAKLFEAKSYDNVIVMVQAEVARRLCGQPGTKEYGAFTVFCNVYREPGVLFEVPPDCFMPMPAVNSSVVRLSLRQPPLVPEECRPLFFRVVRASFAQRRKTIKNALSSAFPPEAVALALEAAGIDPTVRGETLNITDFLGVAKQIGIRS